MAESEIEGTKLVELYHRYVGEPESKRDVYGYWLFLLGSVAGLVGVGMFQVEQVFFATNFQLREYAIVLAAVGLALTMFGIVVLLPVRQRGMQASVVGLIVAAGGVAGFVLVYPQAWNVQPDYSAPIIAVYTVGLAIVAGVAVLVPVVTGEKGLLVEPELGIGSDEPPILLGQEVRDAFFAVYETPTNDWAWRVIQRDAIGEGATVAPTDTDARMAVDDVRERIGRAGLMEIASAAFRLYRTENDDWRWSLVEQDGSLVATNDAPVPARDDVESTVNFLKENAPDADVVEIRGAAFDVYEEGGRWKWRLVDGARRPIAVDPSDYGDMSTAETATETFAGKVADPRVLALGDLGIELFESDGTWRWRVIDGDDRRLVTAADAVDSRRDAETAARDVADRLGEAAVVERGVPGFELYAHGEGWRWRLRDEADDLLARNGGDEQLDRDTARQRAEQTRDGVADADIIHFEGLDYEVYPDGAGWRWRLVNDARTVLADSATSFDDHEAAETAADRVREQALAADLIEFEQAAFQQYESGGEWRWRLIDEDGQVMADSGEQYASKEDVMDGMTTLKENAPDAEVLEIETAAFEIYRTADGDYTWRLIDEAGKLVAEAAKTHPSRAAARDAVEVVSSSVEEADVRPMEEAVFQLHTADESWGFRLIHPDGTILAAGTDDYATRDDATDAIDSVRSAAEGADIDVFGPVTVQLVETDGWRVRLIDRDRDLLAEGDRTYADRAAATEEIDRLKRGIVDAPVFDIGDGIVWIDETTAGWRWRLVDDERTVLAASPERYDDEEAAMSAVETVRNSAPEAGYLDIDTLAFELRRDDADEWRWRLIDEEERTLAVSGAAYDTRESAEDAIEAARDTVSRSSIIEIDEVAFEFHDQEDGWGWRLVDEHGAPLAESVEPHATRQAAREEMLAVKEHAPEGETVVTW